MPICRIAVLFLAAFAVVGIQDEAQIGRWIAELVHADPARRAEAEKQLIKAGPKALQQLKMSFEVKNADLAARAKAVAAEIERLDFEKKFDATQRPRRLEIVTLQIKDAPLSEALKVLGGQVDSTFHTTVDAKLKLTIDVKDVPLRKCLDQMEDALKATIQSRYSWHKVVAGAPKRKMRAYVPGATFEFSLVRFGPNGVPSGWSLTTESTGTAQVVVDSFEVFDRQKAAVEVERCGRCSPRFVRLLTEKEGPFTVRLKGRLIWESPYSLDVTDPAKPQDFKVGPFAIKYEWPKATWTASEPVPERLIGRAELAGKLKKQFKSPGVSDTMGVAGGAPPARQPGAWCLCGGAPQPVQPPSPPAMLTSGSYFEGAFRARKPDQFDSMKVRFYKAIEESFEAEAIVPVE